MLTHRGGVCASDDRQNIGQELRGDDIGHERSPARFEIEPLWRDVMRNQLRKRRHSRRSVILQAARRWFARRSYEAVSLRLIAKEAGYDVALVVRYFGPKSQLFEAALTSPGCGELGTGEDIAERLIAAFPSEADAVRPQLATLLMVVKSSSSKSVGRLVAEFFEGEIVQKLAARLSGGRRLERARVTLAAILGLLLLRQLVRSKAISAGERTRMRAVIAAALSPLDQPPRRRSEPHAIVRSP